MRFASTSSSINLKFRRGHRCPRASTKGNGTGWNRITEENRTLFPISINREIISGVEHAMGDARRVDARRKGVARGGTKRWHGTFVPDVTGRRYYPFKLVIFGKYRFEKPITLFPHCAHSHPVEARASIYLRFHPLRAVGARGPGVLPEVKPTKVIPKTAQVMPLLSSGKKKRKIFEDSPWKVTEMDR